MMHIFFTSNSIAQIISRRASSMPGHFLSYNYVFGHRFMHRLALETFVSQKNWLELSSFKKAKERALPKTPVASPKQDVGGFKA